MVIMLMTLQVLHLVIRWQALLGCPFGLTVPLDQSLGFSEGGLVDFSSLTLTISAWEAAWAAAWLFQSDVYHNSTSLVRQAADLSSLMFTKTLLQNQLGYWFFLSVSDIYHDFASELAGLLPDKSSLASAKTFHACHNISSKCELGYAWYSFHFQYDVYNIIVLQMSAGMLSDPLLRGQLSGCDSHLSQLSPADLPLGTYVMEKPQEYGDPTSELSTDETPRHFSISTVPEMAIIGWSCWLWAMRFVN